MRNPQSLPTLAKYFALIVTASAGPIFGQESAAKNSAFETASGARKHQVPFFVLGGIPNNNDATHPVIVLLNEAYAVGYSENRQNPLWSAYHVDKTSIMDGKRTTSLRSRHDRPDFFYTDSRTVAKVPGGKTFPGFDRGHMTPNNAIQQEFGRLAQLETFLMSNISPQVGALNSGVWRTLEHAITAELVGKWDDLWIVAGPHFKKGDADQKKVKDTNVQVPDGFYMIIVESYYDRKRRQISFDSIAFLFPNNKGKVNGKALRDFVTSIDDIESATQLDFFTSLPEQDELEATKAQVGDWFNG